MSLAKLEPQIIWDIFGQISKIPRGSGNTKSISKYLQELAIKHKLSTFIDSAENLIITKPASEGYENAPGIILQAHMDMVCTKSSDSTHNFETDPIVSQLVTANQKQFISATDTTLGADNGIGVAAGLAIIFDETIATPKLELLLTVDEETTMSGAQNIQRGILTGKYMINLDSEEIDTITVGSAGGFNQIVKPKLTTHTPAQLDFPYLLKVQNCSGGHSGCEIHKGHANAIKVLFRVLAQFVEFDIKIATLRGGSADNAIPTSAEAIFYADSYPDLSSVFGQIEAEFASTDSRMQLVIEPFSQKIQHISSAESAKIIDFGNAAPSQLLKIAGGLVESSVNLGIVSINAADIIGAQFVFLGRSTSNSQMEYISQTISGLARLAGFEATGMTNFFGGWTPAAQSKLLEVAISQFNRVLSVNAKVEAVHAGLECGEILQAYPGVEAISIGPTIINAHSYREAVEISTVGQFWEILQGIIKIISCQ
ncbi:Aminoacyl-histidine dipeptidase [Spironucleus salmonicida]|uniref:Aminoacyl-histidine dipeptidase n=1 Tax=Spironucleus salmonicida TaxID=348837 RepID=V6LFK6_9EUKA|nr:Aminoacyl-histidine dipeptidase [Spironucleus salmonicida]|eukprot:EST43277.1 Aminoacyl-histidine dipeptidase [Spironucleus salmonicida]